MALVFACCVQADKGCNVFLIFFLGNCTLGPGVDLGSQDEHYEAVFQAFEKTDWFQGVFWWNWVTDPAFVSFN